MSSGNCIPAYVFRMTRNQGEWSAPTCVYQAGARITGLVFTSPATAYYVADNKVFRLTNAGSKVAFTAFDVKSLCHVSIVPEGKLTKPAGSAGVAQ